VVVEKKLLLLASLGPLGTVLTTALHTTLNALGIKSTTDDVVTNTRKVLNTAAANQNDGVLLQVVANTGNVGRNLIAVGETYTGDLTKRRVRLLGSGGTNSSAHASLLRRRQIRGDILQGVQTLLQCRSGGLKGDFLSALSDKLVKSRHVFPPFLDGDLLSQAFACWDQIN
jgi:hypothetical protein